MIRLCATGFLMLTLMTVACNGGDDTQDPEQVVEAFFADYLEHVPPGDRVYAESPYVTAHLVTQLDAALEGPIAADPVLCAQNVPQNVSAEVTEVIGDTAVATVTSDMRGHEFQAGLVKDGDAWKLDSINCTARG
ncbi:MAG: DUF3828 domain-containing protein [Dehalococcoidia bacterium]|nr:DUF3828 domain-containing protein [Dehalococcoidia bacterium]